MKAGTTARRLLARAPWRSADVAGALAALGCQLAAFVLLATRAVAWPVAALPLLAGAGFAARHLLRLDAVARDAAALCGQEPPPAGLARTIAALAAQLEGFRHRADRRHPVTGLPTREHLFAAIDANIAGGCGARVLGALRFADFDRLSAFNAAAANAALAAFAARLAGATRAAHVLAHVDRDCFAIWFRAAPPADATDELRAIAYAAAQEMEGDGIVLTPMVEAGMVLHPDDGDDSQLLLTRAIVALAPPGRDADGALALARPAPTAAARADYVLEQDLRQAIDAGQLSLRFQPVVDLAARRIVSAEALLRWDHPTLGAVSPAHFIPVVEATGQSERYGAWVLNAALRAAKTWRAAGLGDLRVAVNLSACQLLDSGLIAKIGRTLERHGVGPDALELELTETAAMANSGRTRHLFGALHAMGVSLAIDDFGSGYSSLSYLKNLPFDKLKIDREFVREAQARRDSLAICRALLELGRGLDLAVLAEGVETADEVRALHALGCTLFQGYYFARPMQADAFLAAAADPAWVARRLSALDVDPAVPDRARHRPAPPQPDQPLEYPGPLEGRLCA